jgi:hypothetical protein
MRILKLLIPVVLILVLTSGIYRHDRPIEKYLALAKEKRFGCAGQLLRQEQGKWIPDGSFVLIDSIHILSAAHCFTGDLRKDTVVEYNGQKVKTYVSQGKYVQEISAFRFMLGNKQLLAKQILIHPDYMKDGSCDIALITLEKPFKGLPAVELNKVTDELQDTVIGVGFGASGPGNRADLVKAKGQKLAGRNIIDSVGGVQVNAIGTMIYADFDSPDELKECNQMGDARPLDMEYSVCGGDSGGPLFRIKNGHLQLVGITTFGENRIENLTKNRYYCQNMGWTRISAFYGWITKNCTK